MKSLNHLYFVRLFKTNKWLFLFVSIFFIVNIAANLIVPTEITPVYNWNLYAYPMPSQPYYTFLKVTYNGDKTLKFQRTWNSFQQMYFTNTLAHFIASVVDSSHHYSQKHYFSNWLPNHPQFKKRFNDFKIYSDSLELKQFPAWYKRYLQQYTGEQIDSIHVYRIQAAFTSNGSVKELSSHLIYTIK